MKLDLHGIRFRMFLVYLLFAVGIISFIGVLQMSLVRPYYRDNKTAAVKNVSDAVQRYMIDSGNDGDSDKAFQVTVDNNVCVVLFNDRGARIYEADSLGSGCVFTAASSDVSGAPVSMKNAEQMKQYLDNEDGEFSLNLTNNRTQQEMIVYGRTIKAELGNYYLFVNSPLEPIDSIITFFFRQYLYYTIIAMAAAVVIAYVLSNSISKPIVEMNRQADRLAQADYSAQFNGGAYTETKELAETLNGATEKLSKIDELRKDLIANVSHDFKTPLTSIRAYAEMIRDISGDNPKKRNEHLDVIIGEADYLDHLVTDMSELSKMQSGNYELNLKNFDLSARIKDILALNRPLFEANHQKVETSIPEELTVYADDIKISQVLNNYISNAIKHTPADKTIHIIANRIDEETVRVEVRDEGEGIPADELPLIWDRYQKSSRSFYRTISNTGLGLAIVKAILDAHHAKFGVESTEGEGSMFWFELKRPSEQEEMHV